MSRAKRLMQHPFTPRCRRQCRGSLNGCIIYIYIYLYMYICIYAYMCVYIYTYITHMCIYLYTKQSARGDGAIKAPKLQMYK